MNEEKQFQDKAFKIANIAIKSMLYEVSAFPKPGLVTPISNGAHKDMNYFTFIDSTTSLIQTMYEFSKCGFASKLPYEIFNEARQIGKIGDKEMLKATNNINTHKGMIFLMGICCASSAKTIYDNNKFCNIRNTIKEMTKNIVKNDLEVGILKKSYNDLSYGEKLYKNYGIAGVREEVENGLPIIFDYSLKLYEDNMDLNKNDRLVHTLIGIMSVCEDTNIIHRHNIDVLQKVNKKAKYIMDIGSVKTNEGRNEINNLSKKFIKLNISPGGCADLLAITVFFHEIKKMF